MRPESSETQNNPSVDDSELPARPGDAGSLRPCADSLRPVLVVLEDLYEALVSLADVGVIDMSYFRDDLVAAIQALREIRL